MPLRSRRLIGAASVPVQRPLWPAADQTEVASAIVLLPSALPRWGLIAGPSAAIVGHVQSGARNDERAPEPPRQIDVGAALGAERPMRVDRRFPAVRTPACRLGCSLIGHGSTRSICASVWLA